MRVASQQLLATALVPQLPFKVRSVSLTPALPRPVVPRFPSLAIRPLPTPPSLPAVAALPAWAPIPTIAPLPLAPALPTAPPLSTFAPLSPATSLPRPTTLKHLHLPGTVTCSPRCSSAGGGADGSHGAANFNRHLARLIAPNPVRQATKALAPGQRARVGRIVSDWAAEVAATLTAPPVEKASKPTGRYVTLVGSGIVVPPAQDRYLSSSFASYLASAHHHPAVARREGKGVRRWFDRWRSVALSALARGAAALSLATAALVEPRGHRAADLPAPAPPDPTLVGRLRERLAPTLKPNPPTPRPLTRVPQTEAC
jgi:hypothetical protein